ncbi:MAG3240 family lipoprotein [Metamycoplasma neophronis]|uniref:Lipoprotein n=1 Tax=Metamycoplasma neophronis TaxID=872983 RepID=A0ABY2Z0B8_9BACT|nr:hypothetical protein [Metamycoplasma neophronis]TPR53394.1 hypothetical protein FJR74_02680 [Metamycoplasma neophronis]
MKKNYIPKSILFATSLITVPVVAVSCQIQKSERQSTFLDINKVSRVFLHRLSLGQIASLHNSQKIFYYYNEKDEKKYFDNAIVEDDKLYLIKDQQKELYKFDFPYQPSWKQFISKFNNVNIEKSAESMDINSFLNQFTFDEIDTANGFNDEWFTILSEVNKHDYNRVGDPYFADMQTIIFRLIQDEALNYSTMNRRYMVNKDGKQVLFDNLFQTQYIQASAWLSKEHKAQRDNFESILLLYLNRFNVNVGKIEIDWDNAKIKKSYSGASDYVEFKIKDIKDMHGNSIMDQNKKDVTYYINNFRTYATDQKFGVGIQGLEETMPLFTDYIPNPLLYMNGGKYLNIVDNINYFIKGATSFDYWNAKGLIYLFEKFKDKFFYIKVPEYKQAEDKAYEIIDFKFTPYFNTAQLIKAIVRVYKHDGSSKDYVWISSNFDDHGHRLKGMITKNVGVNDVEVPDIYSFNPNLKPISAGIKLNDFLDYQNPNSAFNVLLERAGAKLENLFSYWNNDSRSNYEPALLNDSSFQVKILNSYINNYLLAYELENKAGVTMSGVKRIDIKVLPNDKSLGQAYLRLDFKAFANDRDFDFENKDEKTLKSVYLYWNGFRGYDKSKTSNLFTIDKIVEGGE